MTNKHNWLGDIEYLENTNAFTIKKGTNEELCWLMRDQEYTENYLEGIERLEIASTPLLKSYINRGILGILQKRLQKKQLNQYEMKMFLDFRSSFPNNITLEELEDIANA